MTHAKNLFAVVAVWVIGFASGHAVSAQAEWKAELARELPVLGHRNWVVVADSAYPSQTAPGIKTIYTGGEQIEVVRAVLAAVDRNEHVRGTLFLDAELPYVPEEFAPGIDAYRRQLPQAMDGRKATSRPHDEIIAELDENENDFTTCLQFMINYNSSFCESKIHLCNRKFCNCRIRRSILVFI